MLICHLQEHRHSTSETTRPKKVYKPPQVEMCKIEGLSVAIGQSFASRLEKDCTAGRNDEKERQHSTQKKLENRARFYFTWQYSAWTSLQVMSFFQIWDMVSCLNVNLAKLSLILLDYHGPCSCMYTACQKAHTSFRQAYWDCTCGPPDSPAAWASASWPSFTPDVMAVIWALISISLSLNCTKLQNLVHSKRS